MRGDRYSRTVAWLKVALPLAALGLLSTLFLLSRVVDPTESIPFADTEVQDRLLNQQISGPYYSGTTANGDQIAFVAEKVVTPNGLTGANRAEDVFVKIEMVGGTTVNVTSKKARVNVGQDVADLTGNVVITTSQGYIITSEALIARIAALDLHSPDTVFATTPAGELVAGSMRLMSPETDAPAQLVFTNGVKLIYQPKQVKD
ncbi:LPS export ABC transporter periplasmic protein LptC [uncultured Roseobacter sp.]|uniref:LPS export ABC transporter periplasmic protein LptC n=1 Tax=uncultured Roseobacter sp. TaxID=114847 RepID=UPI002633DA7A|nr:LPS export ABC transporter periplasmic protein LptC [uncultured Roseobacter sp.]